jgi:eukaryotic translation initiation factor 2C
MTQAKKMLKNLRVKAKHNNMEFKIIGLSDQPCSRQTYSSILVMCFLCCFIYLLILKYIMHRFPMKVRNGSIEVQTMDITVQDYFKSKQVELTMPYLPCLDVGKPKRPNYLPIEVAALFLSSGYYSSDCT